MILAPATTSALAPLASVLPPNFFKTKTTDPGQLHSPASRAKGVAYSLDQDAQSLSRADWTVSTSGVDWSQRDKSGIERPTPVLALLEFNAALSHGLDRNNSFLNHVSDALTAAGGDPALAQALRRDAGIASSVATSYHHLFETYPTNDPVQANAQAVQLGRLLQQPALDAAKAMALLPHHD